jgi:hypothetical protein
VSGADLVGDVAKNDGDDCATADGGDEEGCAALGVASETAKRKSEDTVIALAWVIMRFLRHGTYIGKMHDSKKSTIMSMEIPPQLGRVALPVLVPMAAAIKIMIMVWKIMRTIRGLPPTYMKPAAAKRPIAKRPWAMA